MLNEIGRSIYANCIYKYYCFIYYTVCEIFFLGIFNALKISMRVYIQVFTLINCDLFILAAFGFTKKPDRIMVENRSHSLVLPVSTASPASALFCPEANDQIKIQTPLLRPQPGQPAATEETVRTSCFGNHRPNRIWRKPQAVQACTLAYRSCRP